MARVSKRRTATTRVHRVLEEPGAAQAAVAEVERMRRAARRGNVAIRARVDVTCRNTYRVNGGRQSSVVSTSVDTSLRSIRPASSDRSPVGSRPRYGSAERTTSKKECLSGQMVNLGRFLRGRMVYPRIRAVTVTASCWRRPLVVCRCSTAGNVRRSARTSARARPSILDLGFGAQGPEGDPKPQKFK